MIAKYDVVVIGAGPGGYVAAIRASQLGLKTALVEKEPTLGGTCLNVGCIPSKALLQSTEHLSWIQHQSKKNGIECKQVLVDFDQMMNHKQKIVDELVKGIPSLCQRNKVNLIQGMARLVSANQIEVAQKGAKQLIEAEKIILATGSEPISLSFMPIDEKSVLSSTGVLSLSHIPKKMVVIGGGVIGVELASVYHRLGTEIVVVEMLEQICPAMDQALSKMLLQVLKKQGMQFFLQAKVMKGETTDNGVAIEIEQAGQTSQIQADLALVAVGRRPLTRGLGLEQLGIQLNKGFVAVDQRFMTSVSGVYAIGDLIEGPMLAHRASEEGYLLAELLAGKQASIDYLTIPNIIYTHPEVAAVGLTEKEAREKGLEIAVGIATFRGNARARCQDEADGIVKVIGAGPDRVLVGMHILGPQASEMIHVGMMALRQRTTLLQLAQSVFGHPTLSETIKEACGQALNCAIHI